MLVNRATNLVEEWAYFPKSTDEQPAFRRRWNEYAKHGQLMLAAGRSEATKPGRAWRTSPPPKPYPPAS